MTQNNQIPPQSPETGDDTLVDHITGRPIDPATGTSTTGHEWDGIRELDTPMPRWWLWTFYASIAFAFVYFILYPAIPLSKQATAGVLGYSSRMEVEDEITRVNASREEIDAVIAETSLEDIIADRQLYAFAVRGGKSAFKLVCVQCHGSGAEGSPGYPNLNDDDWLWGGSLDAIETTIAHGIRNADDDDARYSIMPAFGADGILEREEISDTAEYVLALSKQEHDAEAALRGQAIFEEQCSSCHGENGRGLQELGAPNLTDGIWLYGGDKASIVSQLNQPRHGIMPPWLEYFDKATVRKLAAYVHSLGGTEVSQVAPADVPVATE